MNFKLELVCLAFFVAQLVAPAALRAQQSTPERTIEVAGSVGLTGGLGSVDRFTDIMGLTSDLTNLAGGPAQFQSDSKTKWNVGISGAYTFRPNLMATAEIVRTRLENPTLTLNQNLLEFNAHMLEVTGGLQYEVPLRYSKVVPFAGAGLGLARSSMSVKESTFLALDANVSDNHFTVNFGAGARIHVSDRWGVRPELKVVHIPNETFLRTAVGLFFQFGS